MSDRHLTRKSPSTGAGSPDVWGIYEADTGSCQYVAACPETRAAVLIDIVWNFDPAAYATSTESADHVLRLVEAERLAVVRILDTHPHADHLTASAYLKERLGAPTAIGAKTADIARLWSDLYNLADMDPATQYDALLSDGERFEVGSVGVEVRLHAGHTMGSVSYFAGDAGFVHDTLMVPDSGSARADFPGGSAEALWESICEILSRPEATRLFVGHDYGKDGRAPMWEATVAEHLAANVHVRRGTGREDFLRTRRARAATLPLPDRMLAALRVNLRGGRLPEPEADGHVYLKIPVNRF